MGMMDIAAKVAGSTSRGGGNWLTDGAGILIVQALKFGTRPKFYNGDTFVAELVVESSQSYADSAIKANPPGSVVSFIQQFEEFPQTAFSNTRGFLMSLCGETDASLEEDARATADRLASDPAFKAQVTSYFKENPSAVDPKTWDAHKQFTLGFARLTDEKDNPARGMRIAYKTYHSKPTAKGNILTLPSWTTIQQDAAAIAAVRAKLDAVG